MSYDYQDVIVKRSRTAPEKLNNAFSNVPILNNFTGGIELFSRNEPNAGLEQINTGLFQLAGLGLASKFAGVSLSNPLSKLRGASLGTKLFSSLRTKSQNGSLGSYSRSIIPQAGAVLKNPLKSQFVRNPLHVTQRNKDFNFTLDGGRINKVKGHQSSSAVYNRINRSKGPRVGSDSDILYTPIRDNKNVSFHSGALSLKPPITRPVTRRMSGDEEIIFGRESGRFQKTPFLDKFKDKADDVLIRSRLVKTNVFKNSPKGHIELSPLRGDVERYVKGGTFDYKPATKPQKSFLEKSKKQLTKYRQFDKEEYKVRPRPSILQRARDHATALKYERQGYRSFVDEL